MWVKVGDVRAIFVRLPRTRPALMHIKAGWTAVPYRWGTIMNTTARMLSLAALLAALAAAGCGKSNRPAADTAAAPSPAAAAANPSAQPASGRAVSITANDTMKFSVTEIRAKPGEALAVTLVNEGTMPKFSMGHNWVLLASGVDLNAFAGDAAMAAKKDYVPDSYQAQIIAASKLLGPKETDTVLFQAPSQPGRYPFVCSFPGHLQVGMKGELIVE